MVVDRKIFFAGVRPIFTGGLRQVSVDGLDAILGEWEACWQARTPLAQLAYIIATPWLETDQTMQPIHEYGNHAYFMRMYDKTGSRPHVAVALGNTQVGDGALFPGMGLTQSTGRGNARRSTKRMRELGYIDNAVDFERNPEFLMLPKYAVPILFIAMEEGWYTGKKLDDYIPDEIVADEHVRFVRSRHIVNGEDRAERIASAADTILKALTAATEEKTT